MKKIKNKKMLYIILTCIIVLLIGGLAIFEVDLLLLHFIH